MGGQLNYFGLWLDENFGSGHSRGQPSCTTYGSPPLSAEEEFKIDRLEAWGVGVPPENLVSLCFFSCDSDSINYENVSKVWSRVFISGGEIGSVKRE